MILEQQVCTLEQAKKLAALGIEQRKGMFEWCVFMPDPLGEKWFYAPVYFQEEVEKQLHEWIASAFTVAELMTMLPSDWALWTDEGHYACGQYHDMQNLYMLGKTAAEAVAAELIVLIEGEIISVEECNKRLNQ